MQIALSLAILTVIALVLGAFFLFRQGERAKQAWLMLILAAVLAGNVAIVTWPTDSGQTLVGSEPDPD